jgi:hypothetical protein
MFSDRSTSNTIEITDSEIRGTAPSVFAEAPMPGASNRYTFLPTGQILSAMRQEGWKPVEARQMGVRRLDHSGFQRHMVRFQRRDLAAEVGDYASKVIFLNSHDRSSGYQIHAGLFRWVCRNGLMFADSLIPSVHVRHTAHELPEIIRASFQILEQLPRLADRVADFRAFNLADAVAQDFAPAGRLGDTVRGDLSKPRQTKLKGVLNSKGRWLKPYNQLSDKGLQRMKNSGWRLDSQVKLSGDPPASQAGTRIP